MIRTSSKKTWGLKIVLSLSLVAGCLTEALAADTITGVVHNQTLGRLATDDAVILLRLDQGMQEEARTKTDSQGAFTLKEQHPDKLYLVRVIHQGVNYDQRVLAGDAVSVDVFDAAAKVQEITGSIEIIRIGTNGNLLHVSDMIEIRNNSRPPLTQAGERTFEVYLPAHAKVDSVLAADSGKIGVMISAEPVPGEPEHYTVNFPLRPGATKFAFNYDLLYDGHATFHTKSLYPLQQLAVMIPPTMKFMSRSPAFQVLPTGNNSYLVEAANLVKAGERPEFEISGVGALPALQTSQSRLKPPTSTQSTPPPPFSTSASSPALARAANALSTSPTVVSSPSSRWQELVLSVGAVLLIGACGFLLWNRQRLSGNATIAVQKTEQPKQNSASLVQALKEELFQLEIEWLQGTISGEEYVSGKQALESAVKWALARTGTRITTKPVQFFEEVNSNQ